MFCKCFWRKKRTSEEYVSSSQVKVAGGHSEVNASIFEKDAYKAAVEATSLEMKQQELDGR